MIESIVTLAEPDELMMERGRKEASALNITDKDLWHIYVSMAYQGSLSSHISYPKFQEKKILRCPKCSYGDLEPPPPPPPQRMVSKNGYCSNCGGNVIEARYENDVLGFACANCGICPGLFI